MAGFDFSAGCSNNMLAARARGMVNAGTWGRRFRVSAAAVVAVMRPTEAHHTGTGLRGRSRLTPVLPGYLQPTEEQLAAMRAFDSAAKAAKAAKAAPPRVERDRVARYLRWPTSRLARRIPTEVVERLSEVWVFADGRMKAVKVDGRTTICWEQLSGLVVARAGQVIFTANVNAEFDDAEKIAARIAPRVDSAGPAGGLVAAQAAGSIT